MADETTPHGAALSILRMIAFSEGKNLNFSSENAGAPTREWLLWTYAQCLQIGVTPKDVSSVLGWPSPISRVTKA
jgi:hypothetical protein